METPDQPESIVGLTARPRDIQMTADLQDFGVLRDHLGGDARRLLLQLHQERLLGGIMLVQQHLDFLQDSGVVRARLDSGLESVQLDLKSAMLAQQHIFYD